MPRVKHILKGKEVIQAWLEQSQDWARTSSGKISFKGEFIFNVNFEQVPEDRYASRCCGRRWVMPNGDIAFTFSCMPYHSRWGDEGYDGRDMIKDYCRQDPEHRFYSDYYMNGDIYRSFSHSSSIYIYEPQYYTVSLIAGRFKSEFDRLMQSYSLFKKWGLPKPDEGRYDSDDMKGINLMYSDKLEFGKVLVNVCSLSSFETRKRQYDAAYGEGLFMQAIRKAFNECAEKYGVQVANPYPFESDGRKIKLSAVPRVKLKVKS